MRPESRLDRTAEISVLLEWNSELYTRQKTAVTCMPAADEDGLAVLVREFKRVQEERREMQAVMQSCFLQDVLAHCARHNKESASAMVGSLRFPGRA